MDARIALWDAYDAYVNGQLSRSALQARERSTAAEVGADFSEYDATQRTPQCEPNPCPPAQKILDVAHRGQSNNYYCGPATGVMIANFRGKQSSAETQQSLTQANMANDNHMKTTTNEITSWYTNLWTAGLNKWLKGQPTGYYGQIADPSSTRFRKALRYNIDNNRPFGVSTVEWEDEGSYNFHQFNEPNNSNQAIGHWIDARGYSEDLDRTHYLDPATTVWPNVQATFSRATNSMVTQYVDNGISAG